MKVFATLTLLILFPFSPYSSDALYLASPSWDFNIANLVKHTDLVVLGKVTGMRLMPQERSTSITLKVESVIKGDKAVGDSLLSFTVMGDAGMKPRILEGFVEFTQGEQVLLFVREYDGDYHIYHPSAKAAVEDNKVYISYTYKINSFSDYYNEMRERKVRRSVELPLDLVVKVAKASIKDYDAITKIEADVATAVPLTEKEARSSLSVELLKRLEETIDQILEKGADGDEWSGTWRLASVDSESFEQPIADEVVDIPDSNLRDAIEWELDKAASDTITTTDMERLTMLDAREVNISDLTGLEYATNLTALALDDNSISDISLLSGLINLTHLSLGKNSISDILPLSGLSSLTHLWLHYNSISDISVSSGLPQLTMLWLSHNSISDISAVAGLTHLTELRLHNNSISDISAVSGLGNLIYLYFGNNNISDISPLVSNTGLESGDRVLINNNPLNAASINTHIPALQNRGVKVHFDTVVKQPIDIPSPNLRDAIEGALGKPAGDTITALDIAMLTTLEAPNARIKDLTGLEYATNLRTLNLLDTGISDISAVAGLTKLTWLDLFGNNISDISAVAGLINLIELNLMDNLIPDISAVAGLTKLTGLNLWDNNISDISALSGLTNLIYLNLMDNAISDISALSGLTNLTKLWLSDNTVSDISAVAGLTNLGGLYLSKNNISDISALTGLTKLIELRLDDNNISDISPLVANTGLGSGNSVDVRGNPLSAESISTYIPTLRSRGVTVHFE